MGTGPGGAAAGWGFLGLGMLGLVPACGAPGRVGIPGAEGWGFAEGAASQVGTVSRWMPDSWALGIAEVQGDPEPGGSPPPEDPQAEGPQAEVGAEDPSLEELWAEDDPWAEDGVGEPEDGAAADPASGTGPGAESGQEPGGDPWTEDDPWAEDDPWGEDAADSSTEDSDGGAGDDPWGMGANDPSIEERVEAERDRWRGSLMTRYRGRFAGRAADHDLYQVLTLEFGDAAHDRWTGLLMGQASYDLDGDSDLNNQFAFFSLDDTYDSRLTSELYLAYADYHGARELEVLRVGRQQVFATPEFAWFDGIYAETNPIGSSSWQGGIYGGIPVYPFESSSDGDAIYGAFVEVKPWKGARWRADWMHLEDENLLGPNRDDLWALSWRQTFGERLYLRSSISWLEDEARDWSAGIDWVSRNADWLVDVEFRQLLSTQVDRATPFDPFFATLLQQFPARELRVNVAKDFGESVQLQGGFDVRRVDDDGDIGRFNRDFERGYLNLGLYDALPSDMELTLTGEVWDSPQSDVLTWGVDVSKDLDDRWTASVGSAFSLFKYEPYLVDEREDVRTWYARATHDAKKALRFEFSYELESNDFDDFHILRGGLRWRF